MYQQLLLCSEDKQFLTDIQRLVGDLNYSFRLVKTADEINSLEMGYKPAVIVIESQSDRASLNTVYDAASKKFKSAAIIVIYDGQLPFEFEALGGRRLHMTFIQRPFEEELLLDALLEKAPVEIAPQALKLEHLMPVRISDIRANDKFNFDMYFYMAANKKILLYRKKNSTVTGEQLQRFEAAHVHDLYIRKTDARAFHEYATRRIRHTMTAKDLPITEKRVLLQKEIKDLFGGFFDASQSNPKKNRAILSNCKQVVGQLITEINPKSDVYEHLLHYTAQLHSNYSHTVNVSVFCALFVLVLGNDDVETAAIGGMLHDIGLSTLPKNITKKTYEAMSPEEKSVYHTHPLEGLKLLQTKKVVASESVHSLIVQHHEFMDGSGYPYGLTKDRIHLMARICQIADELDELTSVRPGKKSSLSPLEALNHMIAQNITSSGGEKFDSILLEQLKGIFTQPAGRPLDMKNVKELFDRPVELPKSKDSDVDMDLRRRKRIKRPG